MKLSAVEKELLNDAFEDWKKCLFYQVEDYKRLIKSKNNISVDIWFDKAKASICIYDENRRYTESFYHIIWCYFSDRKIGKNTNSKLMENIFNQLLVLNGMGLLHKNI
jgi:hypothetical protein